MTRTGYGLEEHLWTNPALTQSVPPDPFHIQNSEGTFIVSPNGMFMDTLRTSGSYLHYYQTFTASYEGRHYQLTTELEHIIVGTRSPYTGTYIYKYYLNVIKP